MYNFVYTLLKIVGHYYASVLSMSVIGLQKMFGWVGGVSSIQFFGDFFILQSP